MSEEYNRNNNRIRISYVYTGYSIIVRENGSMNLTLDMLI